MVGGIGWRVAELVPSLEPGLHSPPLTWEYDTIPGTPHCCIQGRLPYRVSDYVLHT